MKDEITKEWLYQKYIVENLSQSYIADMLGITRKKLYRYICLHGLKKTEEQINLSKKITSIKNYGVDHPGKSDSIKLKRKKTNLERYGVENPSQVEKFKQNREATILERYGVKNAAQNEEIKDKIKQTNLERYGAENPVQNKLVKQKQENTNLKKYGFKTPFQNEEIKDKIKQTNLEKYGVENVNQSPKIRAKTIKTNLKKYGFNSQFQNEEIKNKIKNTNLKKYGFTSSSKNLMVIAKIKKTNNIKYGFNSPTQNPKIKEKIKNTNKLKYGFDSFTKTLQYKEKMNAAGKLTLVFGNSLKGWALQYNVPPTSFYNWYGKNKNATKEEIENYLLNYNKKITDIENLISVKFKLEKWDKCIKGNEINYRPDFKLNNSTYLNADGLYWHSELEKEDKNYHFNMRKKYENNGLRIFQFRANEISHKIDIIDSILKNILNQIQYKIGARKTQLGFVDSNDAKIFLEQNHLKGYKNAKHIGLYYQNELVSLMSYKLGKNKLEQFLKIERFCSKVNHNIVGGFSKLLKAVEATYQIKYPIYYWVDLRYGTGDFLLNHGFKLEKETLGWEWTDLEKTYNRLKCRANMDERNLTEKEYADELGWYKIYDAGQRLYVKSCL